MTEYHTIALIVAIILAVLIVAIKNLYKKREMYERYAHHGCFVWVRKFLKGKHRTYCLCWDCKKLQPGDRIGNCPIANAIYKNCLDFNVVTPVWECRAFDSKSWK